MQKLNNLRLDIEKPIDNRAAMLYYVSRDV